jgi:Sec-independent protein secretion pathway component TatC
MLLIYHVFQLMETVAPALIVNNNTVKYPAWLYRLRSCLLYMCGILYTHFIVKENTVTALKSPDFTPI